MEDTEWICRRYANRGLLGVDKFRRIERLGLAGLGLPGHVTTRIGVREAVGKEMTRTWRCTISSSTSTFKSCIVSA